MTGIAGLACRRSLATGLEVDVGSADHDGSGPIGKHIATAEDHTLLAKIGQMHVDGGTTGSKRLGQRAGSHQRIAPYQVDDLLFPFGKHLMSLRHLYWSKQMG